MTSILERFKSGGPPRVWRAVIAASLALGVLVASVAGAKANLAGPAGALGSIAVGILVAAMAVRSIGAVALSVVMLAASAAMGRLMEVNGGRTGATLAVCVALFVIAELATWSTELTVRPFARKGVDRRRWARSGVAAATGLVLGAVCAALGSIGIASTAGLVAVVIGAAAGCLAVGLAVMMALRNSGA